MPLPRMTEHEALLAFKAAQMRYHAASSAGNEEARHEAFVEARDALRARKAARGRRLRRERSVGRMIEGFLVAELGPGWRD